MEKVLLDTNFLFVPFEFKVDVFEQLHELIGGPFEVIVLKECLDEARSMRGFASVEAWLKARKVRVERAGEGRPDDLIIEWSVANNAWVCTNDLRLKRRLKKCEVQVICLMGKSKLGLA